MGVTKYCIDSIDPIDLQSTLMTLSIFPIDFNNSIDHPYLPYRLYRLSLSTLSTLSIIPIDPNDSIDHPYRLYRPYRPCLSTLLTLSTYLLGGSLQHKLISCRLTFSSLTETLGGSSHHRQISPSPDNFLANRNSAETFFYKQIPRRLKFPR